MDSIVSSIMHLQDRDGQGNELRPRTVLAS
jgi:hypothetical protein